MPPLVKCSEFVKRQTADSEFSHFDGSWEELEQLVKDWWLSNKSGYRDDVLLVSVPPEGFHTNIVQLKPGDKLAGEYKSRREGEEPRKGLGVVGGKKNASEVGCGRCVCRRSPCRRW